MKYFPIGKWRNELPKYKWVVIGLVTILFIIVIYANKHNIMSIYEGLKENIGYLKSVHEIKSSKIEELEKRIVQIEEKEDREIIFKTIGWVVCYGCGIICGMIIGEMIIK